MFVEGGGNLLLIDILYLFYVCFLCVFGVWKCGCVGMLGVFLG